MLNLCWLLNWKLTPDPIPKEENYSYQNKSLINTEKDHTEKKLPSAAKKQPKSPWQITYSFGIKWNVHVEENVLYAIFIYMVIKTWIKIIVLYQHCYLSLFLNLLPSLAVLTPGPLLLLPHEKICLSPMALLLFAIQMPL